MLDRDVVRGRVLIGILPQPCAIAAHVRAAQVQNAHLEPFDAANLSFDIGCGGHALAKSSPTRVSGKRRASALIVFFAPSDFLRVFA